jgi:hypothetical protein
VADPANLTDEALRGRAGCRCEFAASGAHDAGCWFHALRSVRDEAKREMLEAIAATNAEAALVDAASFLGVDRDRQPNDFAKQDYNVMIREIEAALKHLRSLKGKP